MTGPKRSQLVSDGRYAMGTVLELTLVTSDEGAGRSWIDDAFSRVAELEGLFSRHDELRQEILAAGIRSGEKLWPMPMIEEYLESLQDGPADLKNIGDRWGGAITAALFLGEFVPPELPWAHLDIAGPAFYDKDAPDAPVGGTGAGVRTLLRWFEEQ